MPLTFGGTRTGGTTQRQPVSSHLDQIVGTVAPREGEGIVSLNPAKTALNLLALPGSVVTSTLKEGTDLIPGVAAAGARTPYNEASFADWWRQITQPHMRVGVGDILSSRETMFGRANPFTPERINNNMGARIGAIALGFAGDVLTDPLSYLGAPGAQAIKSGGRRLLAQSAAANRTSYGLQVGVRRGDTEAVRLADELQIAVKQHDEVARKFAAATDVGEKAELMVARQTAADVVDAASAEANRWLDAAGIGNELDSAIWALARPGGGASEITDELMLELLTGAANTSGLRIRPFWRTSGGRQIVSPETWAKWTSPVREVRGKVGQSAAGQRARGWFGNEANHVIMRAANEFARGTPGNPGAFSKHLALLDRKGEIDRRVFTWSSQQMGRVSDLRGGTEPSQGQAEALLAAIETPRDLWDQNGIGNRLRAAGVTEQTVTGLRSLRDSLELDARNAGVTFGDLGDTYMPVRLRRDIEAGADVNLAGKAAFERQRGAGTTFLDEPVSTVLNAIDAGVARLGDDGQVIWVDPDRMNWAAWRTELDEIAAKKLGDEYNPDLWQKDPFKLIQSYVGQMARRLQAKGYMSAAHDVGLGVWADDLVSLDEITKLRRQLPTMQQKFAEAEAEFASAVETLVNEGDALRSSPLLGREQEALATQREVVASLKALTKGIRTKPGTRMRQVIGAVRELTKSLEARKGGEVLWERQRDAAENMVQVLQDADNVALLREVGALQRAQYLSEAAELGAKSVGASGAAALAAVDGLSRFAARVRDMGDDIDEALAAALDGDDIAVALDGLTSLATQWNGHLREFETLRDLLPPGIRDEWNAQLGKVEQMLLGRSEALEGLASEMRASMTGASVQLRPQSAIRQALAAFTQARKQSRRIATQIGKLKGNVTPTKLENDLGLRAWGFRTFRPDEVEVHPGQMQVRRNVTAEGVTEPLQSDQWSSMLANTLIVWERTDGSFWVVDGHHRTELAKRLAAQGGRDEFGNSIMLPAKVFKESEENDLGRMYLYGALANLGMGLLDEVTLARALRGATEYPEFADLIETIIPKNRAGGLIATAKGLSRLEDPAFARVLELWDSGVRYYTQKGVLVSGAELRDMSQAQINRLRKFDPERHMHFLRGIADVTSDPKMQQGLVDYVPAQGFKSDYEAQIALRMSARSGVVEKIGMFGSEVTLQGIREIAQLTPAVGRALDNAAGTMRGGVRGADVLETVEGTTVARGSTAAEANVLGVIRRAFDIDAEFDPTTMDELVAAAQRISDGESVTQVAAEFASNYATRLRAEIDANGGITRTPGAGNTQQWTSAAVTARQAQLIGGGGVRMADTMAAGTAVEESVNMFGEVAAPPPVRSVVDDTVEETAGPMRVEGETSMFGETADEATVAATSARSGPELAAAMLEADSAGQRAIQREASAGGEAVNTAFAAAMTEYRRVHAAWATPARFAEWFHSTPSQQASEVLRDLPERFAADVASADWGKVATWWPVEARTRAPMPTQETINELQRPRLMQELQQSRRLEDQRLAALEEAAAAPSPLEPTNVLLTDREFANRARQALASNSAERQTYDTIMGENPAAGLMFGDETAKARWWHTDNGDGLAIRLEEAEADFAANPTPELQTEIDLLRDAAATVELAGKVSRILPQLDQPKAAELFNIAANADMAAAYAARHEQLSVGVEAAYAAKEDLGQGLRNIAAKMDEWAQNEQMVEAFSDEFGAKIVQWEDLHTTEDVANAFDAALRLRRPGPILRQVNDIATWWRGNALLSAGYHVRNTYSALINNVLHGVTPRVQKRVISEYTRWARNLPTEDQTMRDFIEESVAYGTVGHGQYGSDIREVGRADTTWNPLAGLPGTNRDQQWRPVHANRAVGNHIENAVRLGAAWTAAQRAPAAGGARARQSAARALVHRIHFDYTDLSNIERNYIRNVSMFWTWMSRNLVLQADMFTKRPQPLLAAERLFRNIGAGSAVNPYTPEYYDENEYRQISQRWFSTLEIPMFAAKRDVNKLSNVISGDAPFVRAMSEYSPYMREGLELLTGRDALRGYELRGSERAKRMAGAVFPLYARARRLAPQMLGGSEGERERQLSSVFGWVGIPLREVSPTEMRYQRRLREDMLRGWAADRQRAEEAQQLARSHRNAAQDIQIDRELAQLAS